MPENGFLMNTGETIEEVMALRRRALGGGEDFVAALANLPKEPQPRTTAGDLLHAYFTDAECRQELQQVVKRFRAKQWLTKHGSEQEVEKPD